ncbi:MAG: LacI family DNA-binding transcriptional regulator [Clostridia bacterium]
MTNIKDIAQYCDVAVSTVSRVLNDHPDVSEQTRIKVMEAVERFHYIPNNSARNLVRTTSDAIALLVKGVNNPFFAKLIKAIEREVTERGFTLELHQIDTSEDELHAAALLVTERKLRGILFLGGRFNYVPEDIACITVPFVMCTYTNSFGSLALDTYSSVAIDDKQAARLAVHTLYELGHRKIAILCNDEHDTSISELRTEGYRSALAERGIAFDRNLVACSKSFSDMGAIYRSVTDMIDRGAAFTAIFAIADLMAIAAIKALSDRGRRVPDDCSVVAIDGLELSAYMLPTLTTLVQPAEEMGLACARTLIDLIEGHGQHRNVTFKTTLRPGGSVLTYQA